MTTTLWILVANASEAYLYTAPKATLFNGSANLDKLDSFGHPQSRLKGADLASDKLGHSGHGTYVESAEPKELEAENFAKELAEHLESGRKQNHYNELVIAAPPHFHGLLNKALSDHVKDLLLTHIAKDYTKFSTGDLLKSLPDYL